jgi:hypothetical protein
VSFDLDRDGAFDDGSFRVEGTGFTADALDFGPEVAAAATHFGAPAGEPMSLLAQHDFLLM